MRRRYALWALLALGSLLAVSGCSNRTNRYGPPEPGRASTGAGNVPNGPNRAMPGEDSAPPGRGTPGQPRGTGPAATNPRGGK